MSGSNWKGQQPQISVDGKGIIRVVFGRNDSIFCFTSLGGENFSNESLVGVVPEMHLGMARGPQLASSTNISLITAMDKKGNIHYFILDVRKGNKWNDKGIINDHGSTAPEGLMNIAADEGDNFYAVWLDTRIGKTNNIFFSSFSSKNKKWSANSLVYKSPDTHVCECCRPSIAVKGSKIAIMFRNWVNGSRDLYLCESGNIGLKFSAAQKLGSGTWKLNGCPMDGGSLIYDGTNTISTTWRRKDMIYYCLLGKSEIEVAKGRDCSISQNKGTILISYTQNGNVLYKDMRTNLETIVGKGSYLKTKIINDKILCVWENDNQIKIKMI